MRLKKILENVNVKEIRNFKNYNIKSISHISKDVIKDSIFICIKGNNFDGNDYISEVEKAGAKCIITDSPKANYSSNLCVIVVEDVRLAMSVVAKNFYYRCCDNLKIIGVVGTAGKTSTSLILSQLLTNCGNKCGVIGTNGIYIDNIRQENNFTTPDPLELHYVFYQMKMFKIDIVIMEVSAQAIDLNKMEGITLDICIFTNISKEHLDYFGSMENYARCKMNYFINKNMKECVVNIDDFFGQEIAYKTNVPCVSYGICNPANSFAIDISEDMKGIKFSANVLDNIFDVDVKFYGKFSVYNLLASLTVCKMLGVSNDNIIIALQNLKAIPGRFNIFDYGNSKIIVDFAHTPESIDQLLSFIKSNTQGRIVSLFGCVGYSDREKRMEIGSIVSKYSDYIIVTTDNRGKVHFNDIASDISEGFSDSNYICIEDRFSAINFGVGMLNNNDTLVLIGKGAETFQKIEDERVPYSDIEAVKKIIGDREI